MRPRRGCRLLTDRIAQNLSLKEPKSVRYLGLKPPRCKPGGPSITPISNSPLLFGREQIPSSLTGKVRIGVTFYAPKPLGLASGNTR